jgi:hypothetical protein
VHGAWGAGGELKVRALRHATGLGAATPAHRALMLWLLTWHCHLLAAQITTSGTEDAAALREAKAAADTSACLAWDSETREYTAPCALDTWTATTEPCGYGYNSWSRGWLGVMCDGGRVVGVEVPYQGQWRGGPPSDGGVGGELLPFFGRLGALLYLDLLNNPALRGDVADLAGATELRSLELRWCPLVVGEAAALAALVHLGEEFTLGDKRAENLRNGDCMHFARGNCMRTGTLRLAFSGVHGPVAALNALPGLGAEWGTSWIPLTWLGGIGSSKPFKPGYSACSGFRGDGWSCATQSGWFGESPVLVEDAESVAGTDACACCAVTEHARSSSGVCEKALIEQVDKAKLEMLLKRHDKAKLENFLKRHDAEEHLAAMVAQGVSGLEDLKLLTEERQLTELGVSKAMHRIKLFKAIKEEL